MMVTDLTDGRFYLLRGGHVIQHRADVPVGGEVTREITTDDARFLRARWAMLKVRRMHDEAAWIEYVARVVGVLLPKVPQWVLDKWEQRKRGRDEFRETTAELGARPSNQRADRQTSA